MDGLMEGYIVHCTCTSYMYMYNVYGWIDGWMDE